MRHIAWNVSARSEEPVLKTFDEERERTLFLIIDASASLKKGIWGERKSYRLAEVVASLAMAANISNDDFGYMFFSDQVEKIVMPKRGQVHLMRTIRDVLYFESENQKTDPDLALSTSRSFLKKLSIVFLVSDFEVLPEQSLCSFYRLRHDFSVFRISDQSELFGLGNAFLEAESAEKGRPVTVDLSTDYIRRHIYKHFHERDEKVENYFSKLGIPFLNINVEEDFVALMRKFLRERRARR